MGKECGQKAISKERTRPVAPGSHTCKKQLLLRTPLSLVSIVTKVAQLTSLGAADVRKGPALLHPRR